ncbi:MAG: hypothetical protein ACYTEG_14115, partial [Planctomycetota bacterium]
SLLEEIGVLPTAWLDSGESSHLLATYSEGISIVSVFDTAKAALNFGTGGLTDVLYGAFVLADPSENRTLAQLSQPSLQTVIVYGAGGGFVRKFTPGQGFAPLTISLGAQFTHGSAMNNNPLSGIGVITNNISNNIRLVSGYASGALPAGVPGQVSPTGFPAGAGKIFCTYMRSTAKTLVVTQGSPGAVWLIKDLFNAVVTKLADTENDPRRTGFFDHKYAITVADPVRLTVKSGPCTPLIAGCEDPGHAIWVPDEDEHRIVASCNGTENLASMAVTIPD